MASRAAPCGAPTPTAAPTPGATPPPPSPLRCPPPMPARRQASSMCCGTRRSLTACCSRERWVLDTRSGTTVQCRTKTAMQWLQAAYLAAGPCVALLRVWVLAWAAPACLMGVSCSIITGGGGSWRSNPRAARLPAAAGPLPLCQQRLRRQLQGAAHPRGHRGVWAGDPAPPPAARLAAGARAPQRLHRRPPQVGVAAAGWRRRLLLLQAQWMHAPSRVLPPQHCTAAPAAPLTHACLLVALLLCPCLCCSPGCAYDLFVSQDFAASWTNLTANSAGRVSSFRDFDWGCKMEM